MLKQFVIYIPAYNAAVTLPRVLSRIPQDIKDQVAEILIVDNASSDDTSLVALNFKDNHHFKNIRVISNPSNMGYGGSQKIAYEYVLQNGYAGVAMLHGDAQYAPEMIWSVMSPVLENKADMVFGSRMSGDPLAGGMPLIRYLGNRCLTTFQNLLLGSKLSEFHSGYRVYSADALRQIHFKKFSTDYHFDTEIIIALLEKKLRIAEVPIPTHYGDEKNYVNIWKYGLDVVWTTLTYFLYKHKVYSRSKWKHIIG